MVDFDFTEQITIAYEKEQRSNSIAEKLTDIPLSYDSITSEWLTQVICKNHPDAKVERHVLGEPDQGMTDRRRIFLHYNHAGKKAKLPAAIFCKASHNLPVRVQNANAGFIQNEDHFYRNICNLIDIETPHCLWSNYNKNSFNSILIFEDLTREGAVFCTEESSIEKVNAKSMLELLAKLHGRFYQSEELKRGGYQTFEEMFDLLDRQWQFEKICKAGFLAGESVIPSRLFQRAQEIWPATEQSVQINKHISRTLTHSDVHLRNWYCKGEGKMGLSDWQCLSQGHWARDVSYALSCALTVENRRQWEFELIDYYLQQLQQAGGPKVSTAKALTYYRQHLFSALSFWTSTLAVQVTQPAAASLEFVRRISTAIDDLDAFSSL